jgi:hypothetical protein
VVQSCFKNISSGIKSLQCICTSKLVSKVKPVSNVKPLDLYATFRKLIKPEAFQKYRVHLNDFKLEIAPI